MLKLYDLTVAQVASPMAAPVSGTRFGWKLCSDKQDVFQTCYRLTLTADTDSFDTGVVDSSASNEVTVSHTLKTGTRYRMTVTVTDNQGQRASAETQFDTAISPEEWTGRWIKPRQHIQGWAPYLRKKFALSGKVKRAVLYGSGLGCAEYYINSKRISDDFIDPPFTNYESEVFYRAFDVTEFLNEKKICFAALLGDGWYAQNRVWFPDCNYGDICLCAELRITYEDGTTQIIATDDSWKTKYSPIVLNNLYAGEVYDARLETPDFADPDGEEEGWCSTVYDETPKGPLVGCIMPPVRILRSLKARSVKMVSGQSDGAWIIDMGENIAGIARFKLPPAPRGAQVTFRFAETLNEAGCLDFRSIGAFATQCIQQETYIARGDKNGEEWAPRFTYHGFRYIEITGYHDLRRYGIVPEIDIATAYILSTDLKQNGRFRCDNSDMMQLQKVMLNTFRTNYHGFPEDCPAREKCGWLGDAQIVCNYGIMNYDMRASYEKFIRDFRTTNEVMGVWQMISPGHRGCGEATPLWGCAQIIMPYWMYVYYGDETVVRDNWDMMEKWVQHELDRAEDYVVSVGLGDWAPPGENSHPKRIPVPQSSTMMFFEICEKMAELSRKLGLGKEDYYADLAAKIKDSILRHFYDAENHIYSTWAANGVALTLGIYPDGDRKALLDATIQLIRDEDYEMHTGIYGNKYLVPVLCQEGYGDDVLRFLFTRDHASFRTMLDGGATTLYECIDHPMPRKYHLDESSYNHPMHSGFAVFYYNCVAGIRPVTPGFTEFEVKPCLFSEIHTVDCDYETPYGRIGVRIMRRDRGAHYEITVPAGTRCSFYPYGADTPVQLTSGCYTFDNE